MKVCVFSSKTDSSIPIVMLPGLGLGRSVWSRNIHDLTKLGCTLYIFEESGAEAFPMGWHDCHSKIDQVIAKFNLENIVLIGNSLGSLFVLDYAAYDPHELALVVISGSPSDIGQSGFQKISSPDEIRAFAESNPDFNEVELVKNLFSPMFYNQNNFDTELVGSVLDSLRTQSSSTVKCAGSYEKLRHQGTAT